MPYPEADRPLPANLDAERAILGAVIVRNSTLDTLVDRMTPDVFTRDGHRRIFAAMLKLHAKGVVVDYVTLIDALTQSRELEAVGGAPTVTRLGDGVPLSINVGHYVDIVTRTAAKRQIIELAGELLADAWADEADTASLIESAEQALLAVSAKHVPGDLVAAQDLAQGIVPVIESLIETKRPVTGIASGIGDLDGYTRGFQPGALIVVAGRPGSGKSSIALQIALDVAADGPVAFFSVEMGAQEQTFRALSVLGRLDGHRLQSGFLNQAEQTQLGTALDVFGNRQFWLDDTGTISPMQIRSRCRRLKARHGLRLVIVDYLQLLQHPRAESREQQVASTTRMLKQVARELGVPIMILSQLSRKVEDRKGKRPTLADLRESGAIEQDADLVLLIYRPDAEDAGVGTTQPPTELIIAKQRNGPLASIELGWMGEQFRFVELTRRTA